MDDAKYGIQSIALNLTEEQFKGYCKGNSLNRLKRSIGKNDASHQIKSMKWWDGAFDKYKHLCKD